MKSLLVKIFGFPATLLHGDTTVVDRWLWLQSRLPKPSTAETLLDVGCGSGAFSIGAAKRGYRVMGLSWDERNQTIAGQRAILCGAPTAEFTIQDARTLDRRQELFGKFNVVICLECIEHILDDQKLMMDLSRCLKPSGRLLLTTPNENYRPISTGDNGPWSLVEDGGHVRRGYTEERLKALCQQVGLQFKDCSYCTGFLSQKTTWLWRALSGLHPKLAWLGILLLRPVPIVMDSWLTRWLNWPGYSICLEARKISR